MSDISVIERSFNFYTQELRMNQFFDLLAENYKTNTEIRAFLRIEKDDLFKIYKSTKNVQGISIKTLLGTGCLMKL